jgi:hypothetical protein
MADMDQTAAAMPAPAPSGDSMGAPAPASAPMAPAATAAAPQQVSADRLERAKAALVKASASGNIEDAAQLASFIREQEHIRNTPSAPGRSDAIENVGVSGADSIAETVSGWFKPQDPKEQSVDEIEGKLAGGAGAGAVGGALLPKALSLASKVAPNKFGLKAGLEAASEAAGKVPASKRIIGGAGGGAAAGAVDVAGESLGAPPAVTFAGELVAGGIGDTAATVLQKGTTQLLRSVANASVGNKAGALRALADIVKPDKALNAKEAARIQEKIFGAKTEGYLDEAIRSDYRQEAYAGLRKADPSLDAQAAASGKPIATASELYRDRYTEGVNKAIEQAGRPFSRTPEAQQFFQQLQVLVQKRELSAVQASDLVAAIKTDTSKSAAVRKDYAETVDNRIRELFSTGHDATGARAIPAQVERELKESLQSKFGDYVKQVTGEDSYRMSKTAYTAEKLAEAKDKFPYFFKDQISRKEFDAFASNLARDPAGKVFLQTELSRHLANVPPQQLVADFNKARSTLVKQGLVGPEDLQVMHQAVKRIAEVADEGLKLKFTEHLRNQLMLALARQPGAKAGGAVGKSRDEGSEWMVPGV